MDTKLDITAIATTITTITNLTVTNDLKAINIAITGAATGITKNMIGLTNVNNISMDTKLDITAIATTITTINNLKITTLISAPSALFDKITAFSSITTKQITPFYNTHPHTAASNFEVIAQNFILKNLGCGELSQHYSNGTTFQNPPNMTTHLYNNYPSYNILTLSSDTGTTGDMFVGGGTNSGFHIGTTDGGPIIINPDRFGDCYGKKSFAALRLEPSGDGTVKVGWAMECQKNVIISNSAPNVLLNLTNNMPNRFTDIFFHNKATNGITWETSHIFSGQGGGLNLATDTNQPIRMYTGRPSADTSAASAQIEILATGNKNVIINSPLVYKPWVQVCVNVTVVNGIWTRTLADNIGIVSPSVSTMGTPPNTYWSIEWVDNPNPRGISYTPVATVKMPNVNSSAEWSSVSDCGAAATSVVSATRAVVSTRLNNQGIASSFYFYTVP